MSYKTSSKLEQKDKQRAVKQTQGPPDRELSRPNIKFLPIYSNDYIAVTYFSGVLNTLLTAGIRGWFTHSLPYQQMITPCNDSLKNITYVIKIKIFTYLFYCNLLSFYPR